MTVHQCNVQIKNQLICGVYGIITAIITVEQTAGGFEKMGFSQIQPVKTESPNLIRHFCASKQ